MRILHTADWHFGRSLEGRSRLEEQAAFVDELAGIVREESIDLVLLAGDVYDSVNPPAAAEQLFYEALSRLADGGKRTVAVIAGNHDHPERVAASAPLAMRSGIRLVGMPTDQPVTVDVVRTGERAVIAALPYPSESRLRELLSEETDEAILRTAYSERVGRLMTRLGESFGPDSVNLAMSHIYVLGGLETDSERPIQIGGAYTVDPSALRIGADYVALGHLHRPQRVHGDERMRYSGSPLAYSFSEAGQSKSVIVFDAEPGKPVQPKELLLSCGRPLVKWTAKGGLSEVYGWLEDGRDSRSWIDLDVWMTETMTMLHVQQLRRLHSGIVHIRPVYPETEASADEDGRSRDQLPAEELFRRFYTRQTGGAEPDAETVRLFLELVAEEDETPASEEPQAVSVLEGGEEA
ncbi:exonuclease SbcCD subunit D C-terminal domain-containing protein [Paenibacillus sp. sptzw28]|uniref:exonuclease SbcCD subunit D n=1 Tax=Paenibacillus sp. sptzw28 TaxID=715179 RepID=UPI001C6E843F|nr:exonuclease SbcCD subunit D [Paenibacillus sp. sptzw28]QYR20148.1 exonuclease SbcCD subunit D C-terminal domain-containing protein [Paenibacillus sp. sptzw28]